MPVRSTSGDFKLDSFAECRITLRMISSFFEFSASIQLLDFMGTILTWRRTHERKKFADDAKIRAILSQESRILAFVEKKETCISLTIGWLWILFVVHALLVSGVQKSEMIIRKIKEKYPTLKQVLSLGTFRSWNFAKLCVTKKSLRFCNREPRNFTSNKHMFLRDYD
jgi:hypothetical protein